MRNHLCFKIAFVFLLFVQTVCFADERSHTLSSSERIAKANDFYQKQIKSQQSGSSTKLEKLERKVTAKQAYDSQDWYGARYAFQRVLADNENDFPAWFMFCKSLIQLQQYDTYQNYDEALEAALVKAYNNAKNPLDAKAVELLASSSRLAFAQLKENALKDTNLAEIENQIQTITKDYPSEFAPYSLELPSRTDIASACILWTKPLSKSRQLQYENFVQINPKVKDVSVIARGNQLCIEGLSFGQNYQLTFLKGLKGENEIALQEEQTLPLFVPHRKASISFREKGYILPSTAPQLIPLTAVNVSKVNVKIIHIPERNIQSVQANWFSNSIQRWEAYNLEEELGELIFEGTYRFGTQTDKTILSGLPIDQMIGKKLSPGVYVVQASIGDNGYGENEFASQALVISDIGLSTYQGNDGLHIYARSLHSAKPLADVQITLIARNNRELAKVKTNRDGSVLINEKLINGKGGNSPAYITAAHLGKEFTALNLRNEAFNLSDRGDEGKLANNDIEGFIFTERGIYRPGETVHLFSLLRDHQGVALKEHPLTLKVFRPDGVIAAQTLLQDKGNGAYLYDYPIHGTALTGLWTVAIYLDPKAAQINHTTFEVNDFVPPRIQVKTSSKVKQLLPAQSATIDVQAQYYYGPMADNLKVQADSKLIINPHPFDKYNDYHFGLVEERFTPLRFKQLDAKTDDKGNALVEIQIDSQQQTTHPLQVETSINVFEIGGRARKVVHLLDFWHQPYLIGIEPQFKDNVANSNSNAAFNIVALDKTGALKADLKLRYTLYEEQHDYIWYRQGSNWQYDTVTRDKVIHSSDVTLKANNPTHLVVPVKYGPYRLEVLDEKTGVASSYRFSSGWYFANSAPDKPDMLSLAFDEKSPLHGNKAKIHIQSPFKGELFLAWAGDKFEKIHTAHIDTAPTTLEIPYAKLSMNGQYLVATVFAPQDEASGQMPKRAIGVAWLKNKQEIQKHQIHFSIEHPKKVRSGDTLNITLKTSKPVKDLRYVVALVDEGTLSLTDFTTPSPYDFFFAQTKLNYSLRDSYGLLINPYGVKPGSFEVGGGESILSRALTQLPARAFKVVSLFSGVVQASEKDTVSIPFTLPQYTGKLRVMATAWSEQGLGSSESNLLVQDPIDVYLAQPRFLAPNDSATVPLILKVLDAPTGNYEITYRADKTVQKQQRTLKNGDDIQVPISMHFDDNGIKNNQITIKGPKAFSLERSWSLSVRPKVQAISLHQYHKLEAGQSVTLSPMLLNDFSANTSHMTLSVGSLPEIGAQGLVQELLQYPYYCLEQTTSKLLASVLNNTEQSALEKGFNQLTTLQKIDGSFSLWSQNGPTEPWLTLYAYDVLSLAKQKAKPVPDALMANLNRWLSEAINRSISSQEDISIAAYAHYLLAKEHQGTLRQLRFFTDNHQKEITQRHDMAFIAAAFAYYDAKPEAATWFDKAIHATPPKMDTYYSGFGSPLRNDAILVTMLAQTTHQHPQLVNLTQALVDQSSKSMMLSTQEKGWLISASHALKEARKPYQIEIDHQAKEGIMPETFEYSASTLNKNPILKNTGANTLYYALSLEGEPLDVKKLPQTGFEINRNIYSLDGSPAQLESLKSGELYLVQL
ncbi:MAG: alpha-2-macroglobulin, partial [Candidatus Berkiella sp.]